jgi:hypothetical protein
VFKPRPFELVEENMGTTYADLTVLPKRWETAYELDVDFMALTEGLGHLGGARVLVMDNTKGLAGIVRREWESLGEVWVA